MPPRSKHNLSGRFVISLKERREKALQLRKDGLTLRQISEQVGIHFADLGRYFSEYKSESIKELREELFAMQTERLYELWRAAAEDMRKFVPVVDAKGKMIMVPILNQHGEPVLGPDGQVLTAPMRDFGVHLNAINVATRVAEKLAAHFGLDAPTRSLVMNNAENPHEITFRIVEGTDGKLVTDETVADEAT
ncbi:MAG: hypothetical protein KA535_03395 [Azonexus sp.]|nr:hypothetical protein [Azonexus sp.]